MKTYIRYQDDGPSGVCTNACSETNPWDELHIFESYDDARIFMKDVEQGKYKKGRLNSKITCIWQDEYKVIRHSKY